MRYITEHLSTIAGVEIYPIISLLIFFFFFVALTLYVIAMRRPHVEYMSSRPLESDTYENAN